MPVLDTQVLFAMQPSDPRHQQALKLFASADGLVAPDTSFFELQAVLRGRGRSGEEVKQVMLALDEILAERDIPAAATIGPLLFVSQCELESEHDLSFFDSLIAASALAVDGAVVSDDRAFDRVPGLRRIPLG